MGEDGLAFRDPAADLEREVGGVVVENQPRTLREVQRLVEQGFVRPVVGARFPLERAADALNAIDQRRATGKVVLDVR